MIQVQIKGNKRVSRVLLDLGPKINKAISKSSYEFLQSVRRGARIMSPKLTGNLNKSMMIKKTPNGHNFVVGASYGRFVEMGYRPHLVSSSAEAYPGKTIAQVYGIPEGVTILVKGPRRKYFIRDAFQNALARLPSILKRRTTEEISR